jgi:pyruvate dehydrogenase E1 component alpha subunit
MERDKQIQLYRLMWVIRRFEERCAQIYTTGKIDGYLHLYAGQEAVALGFISALQKGDYVVDSYRDHAHCMAMGTEPRYVMAELYGKAAGVSKGKGGSMHLFDIDRGFLGGTGIVGGGIPVATGVGLASRYRSANAVCLCFFGDGALNQGVFHESLNMASLWKLPVVYVCENNHYAMGTSVERSSAVPKLTERASSYGMPTYYVDGMDLMAVHDLAVRVIADARQGNGPAFVEADCYRYAGHGAADPATYRTREEVQQWRQRDPIRIFEERLIADGVLTKEDAIALQQEAQREVQEAIKFAEESPEPDPDALYEDVYA